jgi:protein AroM
MKNGVGGSATAGVALPLQTIEGTALSGETRQPRILFVTIGQSPRPDLLAELTDQLGLPATVSETGLLDGLGGSEIEALLSEPEQKAVIARLANGSWVTLARGQIEHLANELITATPEGEFDLIVLMSTGIFRDIQSTCPTVNAQRAVEAAVISVAAEDDKVGIVFPIERQIHETEIPALSLFETRFRHATHGNRAQLQKAAKDLEDCAYIVLNSVGYGEADRRLVADLIGKPVILPRRIIANSIRLILSGVVKMPMVEITGGLQLRLDRLTMRERQIMSLVCEGLSNKAIARQLGISHKTVEIHRSSILKKMEVPSSGALIRLMVKAGFA